MAKNDPQIDVLVVGGHPSAYLAAALLKEKSKLRVVHATIPKEAIGDRLVLVNPELFDLHPILSPLRRKLAGSAIYGLRFLADDAATASEYRSKSAVASVAQLKDVVVAMKKLAEGQEVEFCNPKRLEIRRLDEQGLEVTVGNQELRPKALVLAGALSDGQQRMLGLPEEWERGIVRRYSHVRLKNAKAVDFGNRPLMPMSLDLAGRLSWAWLLPGDGQTQLAVEQPIETVAEYEPSKLLSHWAGVLHGHGVLPKALTINPSTVETLDLPLGGALAHEGVANRTLLIGPAGGFYSASGEDVYPNCWSAIYAAEVLKKALRETHLQDAIQAYRQRWRTTLGDYLRGPQQNLRFLLPLVYRNQVMTNRLAEAILTGKSVVR
jgi:flavin-dependent dehydrogenase